LLKDNAVISNTWSYKRVSIFTTETILSVYVAGKLLAAAVPLVGPPAPLLPKVEYFICVKLKIDGEILTIPLE